jgi:DNA invertase Pin-like site-specific DNA recombinase
MSKIVAYYRVSTSKQGKSGLGLEAQQMAVAAYAAASGSEIIESFTEVESGKNNSRPELTDALELCEITGARLVIAKLDRLSRSVAFLSGLMESKVKFTACDNPEASELTIHILAAVAEAERKAISERTKAALRAAKQRGQVLGNPNIAEARSARDKETSLKKATEARVSSSNLRAEKVMRVIAKARDEGCYTLQAIANYLNENTSIKTPRGSIWTRAAVNRVIKKSGSSNNCSHALRATTNSNI